MPGGSEFLGALGLFMGVFEIRKEMSREKFAPAGAQWCAGRETGVQKGWPGQSGRRFALRKRGRRGDCDFSMIAWEIVRGLLLVRKVVILRARRSKVIRTESLFAWTRSKPSASPVF